MAKKKTTQTSKEIKKSEKEYPVETTDQLLYLMEIYLSEWTHRDSMLWKQVFTYFLASLVVMILPFADVWGFSLGDKAPQWIFPVIGILMSIAFLIIGIGYAIRLRAIGATYKNLIQMFPEEYRRLTIEEVCKKKSKEVEKNTAKKNPLCLLLSWSMSYLIIGVMFVSLILLGLLFLYFSIG